MVTEQKTPSAHVPEQRTPRPDLLGKAATLREFIKKKELGVRTGHLAATKNLDSIALDSIRAVLLNSAVQVIAGSAGRGRTVLAVDASSDQVKSHAKLASSIVVQLADTGVPPQAIELIRQLNVVDSETRLLVLLDAVLPDAAALDVSRLVAEGGRSSADAVDPFELLTASKMATALGVSDETVRNYEKANALFSFMSPARRRGRGYPAFQAMKNVIGAPLSKVLASLKGLDGASIYQFFSSPSVDLAGLTPLEVMTASVTSPRLLNNDAVDILKASAARRLAGAVGAAKAFHADAAA